MRAIFLYAGTLIESRRPGGREHGPCTNFLYAGSWDWARGPGATGLGRGSRARALQGRSFIGEATKIMNFDLNWALLRLAIHVCGSMVATVRQIGYMN